MRKGYNLMTYKLHESLLEKIDGSFICVIDGKENIYTSAKELLEQNFEKNYMVSSITARDNQIVVVLKENDIIPNDLNSDWVNKYVEETGKELSFF